MSSLFLLAFLLVFGSIAHSGFQLTLSEFRMISELQSHFNSRCFVFVADREDVGLVTNIKNLGFLSFTVVNASRLENILADQIAQANFFRSKTTIITKEDLNLTWLLDNVSQPHFLTWIVLKDHTLFRELCVPVHSNVFFVHSTPESTVTKQVYHLTCSANETVRTIDWQTRSFGLTGINFQGIAMRMLFLTFLISGDPQPRESCQNIHKIPLMRKLECVHWDLIEIMAEKFNFSINAVECMEKKSAFTFPNGSDSEIFLKIKHREVELSAIGHVITTRIRRPFMNFVWPTFVLKSMMFLKQGRLMGRWVSYLKPLESSVWWGILICIVVFGVLLQIFERLLNSKKPNVDLIRSVLRTLQVFCNQSIYDIPASCSIRLIYLLEFFVVLIFFQAYCGYLASSLTVVTAYFPFTNLEGFFANPQYRVMTLRNGFHQFYFRKIVGKDRPPGFILQPHELPETIQGAVDKLCTEDYLAFAEFREDLIEVSIDKCRISELPNPVLHLHVGLGMPANAPLKEFFRRELLNLRSTGVLRRFGSRLTSQASNVLNDKRSLNEFSSVSMYHIFSIFILFGFGVLLSVLVFAFEVIVEKTKIKSQALIRKRRFKLNPYQLSPY